MSEKTPEQRAKWEEYKKLGEEYSKLKRTIAVQETKELKVFEADPKNKIIVESPIYTTKYDYDKYQESSDLKEKRRMLKVIWAKREQIKREL